MPLTEAQMLELISKKQEAEKELKVAQEKYNAAGRRLHEADCPHPKSYIQSGMFYTTCDLCYKTLD